MNHLYLGRPKITITTLEIMNKIHDMTLANRRIKVREIEEVGHFL